VDCLAIALEERRLGRRPLFPSLNLSYQAREGSTVESHMCRLTIRAWDSTTNGPLGGPSWRMWKGMKEIAVIWGGIMGCVCGKGDEV